MRHFETRKQANKFKDDQAKLGRSLQVFKKLKGHRNRLQKPFVVGTKIEWLNLY